jgi:hypothetical protein
LRVFAARLLAEPLIPERLPPVKNFMSGGLPQKLFKAIDVPSQVLKSTPLAGAPTTGQNLDAL